MRGNQDGGGSVLDTMTDAEKPRCFIPPDKKRLAVQKQRLGPFLCFPKPLAATLLRGLASSWGISITELGHGSERAAVASRGPARHDLGGHWVTIMETLVSLDPTLGLLAFGDMALLLQSPFRAAPLVGRVVLWYASRSNKEYAFQSQT